MVLVTYKNCQNLQTILRVYVSVNLVQDNDRHDFYSLCEISTPFLSRTSMAAAYLTLLVFWAL